MLGMMLLLAMLAIVVSGTFLFVLKQLEKML